MRLFLALLFAVLVLTGCGFPERSTHYSWSFSGSPEARVEFASAVVAWNTCGTIQGELLPADDNTGTHVWEGELLAGKVGWTGLINHRPVGIVYQEHPRLRQIFLHELGHAYRGDGTHAEGGLMAPSVGAQGEAPGVDCDWIR